MCLGDQQFILKTCTEEEQQYLLQILPRYIEHLETYPKSFLSRYVGCYKLVMYDQTIRFIVMANIFKNPNIHVDQYFDLKGSTVGRFQQVHDLLLRRLNRDDINVL
jgi:1-phosphatidylinositol-4-phosphate 5-kinase